MNKLGLIAISALMLTTAACNESQSGAEGNIRFTPDKCGRGDLGGCDFEDSVGTGGVINVYIEGISGFPTAGVDLVSGDTNVFTLSPTTSTGGRPTWELTAVGAGVARIIALDSSDNEVDFLEVSVQDVTGLTLENIVGDAVGPAAGDQESDEIWTINAAQQVSFYVRPTIGANVPTMGRFTYTATLDAPISDGLTGAADVGNGYLAFSVAAGAHIATFDNGLGVVRDFKFEAQ
jgi:hypothetical protein